MVHPVNQVEQTRWSYSKIDEVMNMPDLIEIQKDSYNWFLKKGLREVFQDISPIEDFTGNLVLEFIDCKIEDDPKYTEDEARGRDVSYSAPLKVKARLINNETGEVREQEVFMGDFPLMTEKGTFIINGAERVIVSQLVRSPGVYFDSKRDKNGRELFSGQIIPDRGAWIELEINSREILNVKVNRTRKTPATALLRALGYGSNAQILELLGEDERLLYTFERDNTKSKTEGLIELYKRLRPGDPPTVENAKNLLKSMFFNRKRYDLAKVGRYKFNKKLRLSNRIVGKISAENIPDKKTGEIVVKKGEKITRDKAKLLERLKIRRIKIQIPEDGKGDYSRSESKSRTVKVLCNGYSEEDDKIFRTQKHVTPDDIIATINYLINLPYGVGNIDDIDYLGNRRIRSVGELLQNQFRIGLSRMERIVKERMTIQDVDTITPKRLINIQPVVASIKTFFGSSQLSQFMDQTNPLAELTHKRRLSALGPGGLSRERAGFDVRDVHHSHYGRICPIETPEGPNIGLIGSLSSFAKVNEYGFIETPYRRVDKEREVVTNEIEYFTADEEDEFIIAQANAPLDEEGKFIEKRLAARYKDKTIVVPAEKIDFMDVSPKQLVSVATAMIPFLEHDDANRALMGSNMQRQAVPLLEPQAPYVGTGIEHKVAMDSGVMLVAKKSGKVERVTANEIVIRRDGDQGLDVYKVHKFRRSNQGTCINQKPIVRKGDKVRKNQPIADGPSTDRGELALGKNLLVAFMPWEGYNYEDAILLSERLVKEDVFTSIHIEQYDADARDTKLGPEEITREIPNVGEDTLKDLDERGIIRIGAEVRAGDILVGKVTPKGETELTAEERLLRAIFGDKAREVRDTSLKVPHGEYGVVVDITVLTRENGDELPPGVNKLVRVYIAQKRKISEGDKMSGRHGNKGVVSRILPIEDMPYLPDGTPVDIVLNPLGVPSRMNIGQVFETHLGMAAKVLGWHVASPVFDGATEDEIMETLEKAGLSRDGKTKLRDGRTGEYFDREVTVGYMYMLKLDHLVDDKIHARSTGPYSLVTQQPLGGKAQFGGQRFGEMEVWALEAYGAAHTLQEMLTVKSDDVAGRVRTYESIVKGENIPEPGIPASFKVLIKDLQSLALDVQMLSENEVVELEGTSADEKE
ncbi:MAG: DNA-directed RNA polymerase subunit beta [Tepidanaerobacteraceae bacterium]|nr:DNA-directed RNA polymerase subunit beta [Tepidanaerobacteraceae bacterium]